MKHILTLLACMALNCGAAYVDLTVPSQPASGGSATSLVFGDGTHIASSNGTVTVTPVGMTPKVLVDAGNIRQYAPLYNADGSTLTLHGTTFGLQPMIMDNLLQMRYELWNLSQIGNARFLDGIGYWFNTQEGFDAALSSGLFWTNPGWANAQPAVTWTDAAMLGTVIDCVAPAWAWCTGPETYRGHDSSQGEDCWKWAYDENGRESYTLIGVTEPHNKYLGYDGNTFVCNPAITWGGAIASFPDGWYFDQTGYTLTWATAPTGWYVPIAATPPTNATLVSTVTTLSFIPAYAFASAVVDIDGGTLATNDVGLYVSRDNGTTWSRTASTIVDTWNATNKLVLGSVDLSAQPSGSQLRMAVTVSSNHFWKILGIAAPCGE